MLLNPSGERGTYGWGTMLNGGGTVGTTSAFQQYGAWAGSCAPTGAANVGGARLGTFTAGVGTAYTVSVHVRGAVGSSYILRVDDNTESSNVLAQTFTTGGTWHRYVGSYTENSGANRVFTVGKNAAANDAFYFDGAQVEVGSLTTFISGDEEGCYWLGIPHQSQSARSGTYRGGGSVIALADLGLKPDDMIGVGMPPMEVTAQSFALQDGAEYQNSRASERPFTLTFRPIFGTTTQGFHVTRRTLIDAFKPDLVDPQQPTRFWYTGGQGTVQIDAVYQAGLELGEMNGPMAEDGALRFIAHDPYWSFTTDEGTALASRTVLGSVNRFVWKDTRGRWGTAGVAGTTLSGAVNVVAVSENGTVWIGGAFGSAGGTQANGIAMFFPSLNTFGTLAGGTLSNDVNALMPLPSGTLVVGYNGQVAGGTTAPLLAQHVNNAWGTWQQSGGTLTGAGVYALKLLPNGTTVVGGDFSRANGSTARMAAIYSNMVWGTLVGQQSNGTFDDAVRDIAYGGDGYVYFGGLFGSAGGTVSPMVARWGKGAFGTLGAGMRPTGGGNQVRTLAFLPSGELVAGGEFGSAGGGTAANAAIWNGQQWFPMGSGISSGVTALTIDEFVAQANGRLLVGHAGSIVGNIDLNYRQLISEWNHYAWLPGDLTVNPTQTFAYPALHPNGTIYLGGNFSGIGTSASVAEVVNRGRAIAYPVIKMWNNSNGTVRIFRCHIEAPQAAYLDFNLVLIAGEVATLTTEPGNCSFTSSYQGNIFPSIIPGSNLSSFYLLPGTSYVTFYADSDSLQTSLYWRPRSWSIDGGTIV